MSSKTVSLLHIYPPQRQHIAQQQTAAQHPISFEVSDYCAKIDKLNPTNIPLNSNRLPVFSFLPKSTERLVFDEVIADPTLFSNIHCPKTTQEVDLLPPNETLDNLACEICSTTHHAQSKILISEGAVGSGHGALFFGISAGTNIPQTGLLWSILDALGSGEYPKVSCFQIERNSIRDLLADHPAGTVLKPEFRYNLFTQECVKLIGLTQLQMTPPNKLKLCMALHQKRMVIATWHAVNQVVDRYENGRNIRLKAIQAQVGVNNYQIGLDTCGTTCVLLQLGPDRDFSTILLVDIPVYAHQSPISDWVPHPLLFDVQKQSAALKASFQNKRDHLIAKIMQGLCPSCYSMSRERDLYIFSSVNVSDLERQQTHSVMRLAAQFDKSVGDRFFMAYKADKLKQGMQEETALFSKQMQNETKNQIIQNQIVQSQTVQNQIQNQSQVEENVQSQFTISQLNTKPSVKPKQKTVKIQELLKEEEIKPEKKIENTEPEKKKISFEQLKINTTQKENVGQLLNKMKLFIDGIKE